MFSKAIFRYAVLAALRDRLLWIMGSLMMLIIATSLFSSGMAISEQNEFALVFMGAGLRILGVLGFVTFIGFHLQRLYDHKEIDYFLSAPVSRTGFLISLSSAYMAMAGIFAAIVAVVMQVLSPIDATAVGLWGISLGAEWLIVVAIAVFFSSIVRSGTVSVLSSLSFYALARMIGTFTGIAASPFGETTLQLKIAGDVLSVISIFVPRFDLMAQSSWLIYPETPIIGIGFVVAQIVVFVGLFLTAAIFDLERNEF